jgi:hypothetical protein
MHDVKEKASLLYVRAGGTYSYHFNGLNAVTRAASSLCRWYVQGVITIVMTAM